MATGPGTRSEADLMQEEHQADDAGTLALEVVTPAGTALSARVSELTAPGAMGELGLLPGHIPLLAALKTGILTYRVGTDRHLLAVGPGYVQVGAADRVRVITDRAATLDEVDLDAVRAERDELLGQLKATPADQPAELKALQDRLEWAEIRLALAAASASPQH